MIVTTHIQSVREFSLHLQSPTLQNVLAGVSKFNNQILTLFLYKFQNQHNTHTPNSSQGKTFQKLALDTEQLLLDYFTQQPKLSEIIALCIKYVQQPVSGKSSQDDENNDKDNPDSDQQKTNSLKMRPKNPSSTLQTESTKLQGHTRVNPWAVQELSFFLIAILLFYFDDDLLPKPSQTLNSISQHRPTVQHTVLHTYIPIFTDLMQFCTLQQTKYDHEIYKNPKTQLPATQFIHAMVGLTFLNTLARSNLLNCEELLKKIDFSRRTILYWIYRVYNTRKPKSSVDDHNDDLNDNFDQDNDDGYDGHGDGDGDDSNNITKQSNMNDKINQDNAFNQATLELYGLHTRTLLIHLFIIITSYQNINLNNLFFYSKKPHLV